MKHLKIFEEFGGDIITQLEEFKLPKVDKLLNNLSGCDNLDQRMGICDDIIYELEINDIDISDMEDDIKDLAIA